MKIQRQLVFVGLLTAWLRSFNAAYAKSQRHYDIV